MRSLIQVLIFVAISASGVPVPRRRCISGWHAGNRISSLDSATLLELQLQTWTVLAHRRHHTLLQGRLPVRIVLLLDLSLEGALDGLQEAALHVLLLWTRKSPGKRVLEVILHPSEVTREGLTTLLLPVLNLGLLGFRLRPSPTALNCDARLLNLLKSAPVQFKLTPLRLYESLSLLYLGDQLSNPCLIQLTAGPHLSEGSLVDGVEVLIVGIILSGQGEVQRCLSWILHAEGAHGVVDAFSTCERLSCLELTADIPQHDALLVELLLAEEVYDGVNTTHVWALNLCSGRCATYIRHALWSST